MKKALLHLLSLILILSSCNQVNKKLSITAYTPGSDSHNAALALKEVLEEEGWKINVVSNSHQDGIEAVRSGEINLAVTSNDVSINSQGLRTIIPLYHEVLTVLVHKNSELAKIKTLPELRNLLEMEKPKVIFSEAGSYSQLLSKRLIEYQGISSDMYETYFFKESNGDYEEGKLETIKEIQPDAIYLVGSEDTDIVHKLMKLGYDFDQIEHQYENIEASATMSFANKMARCFPVVVPTYAFSIYQDRPILTLGIYSSLITGKNMNDATAYELAKEIVGSFPHLVTTNSSFVDLKEDFDRKLLNYKLHDGSRNYFDRDKPSFFERYAELSGVMFSMFVVFITFLVSMNRVMKRRKKDRIDVFYADAQKARVLEPKTGLANLQQLEDKAFNQLISEHLSADASFIVFMQLVNEIRTELKEKQSTSA